MKALTLTQPWASLVVLGEKRLETRSWPTAYRGRIAIHAAKGWRMPDREFARNVLPMDPDRVPRGMVLGTCTLADCCTITTELVATLPARERKFGDYTPGRFAFTLTDVQPFAEAIPARGMLGLWAWDSPEATE